MKTKLAAVILLALMACSKKSDPKPNYSNIAGNWNIASTSLNGQINIFANSAQSFTSRNGSSDKHFILLSEQFLVQISDFNLSSKTNATGLSFSGASDTRTVVVLLKNGTINSTFDNITATSYSVTQQSSCTSCVTDYNESITLTRY